VRYPCTKGEEEEEEVESRNGGCSYTLVSGIIFFGARYPCTKEEEEEEEEEAVESRNGGCSYALVFGILVSGVGLRVRGKNRARTAPLGLRGLARGSAASHRSRTRRNRQNNSVNSLKTVFVCTCGAHLAPRASVPGLANTETTFSKHL